MRKFACRLLVFLYGGHYGIASMSNLCWLLAARADDLKYLKLSWFGGETLLAYRTVLDVSDLAWKLSQDRGIHTVIGVTTNGYHLNRERYVELWKAGIRHYQISLDGDKETHDRTRLLRDGAGTFDRIWRNLNTFNSLAENGMLQGTRIMLRLHIHQGNVDSVLRLAEKIVVTLNREYFSVFIKELGYYGGKNDGKWNIITNEQQSSNIRAELIAILSSFVRNGEDEAYVCYAAKANAYTIRADGSVGKCTVALNDDRNMIGRISRDGLLSLNAQKAGMWLHPLAAMNAKGLACPLNNLPIANC